MTTIWRDDKERNIATSPANVATNMASEAANMACEATNMASDHLAENRRLIDSMVASKVKARMTQEQVRACITEACVVEHSVEELAALLHKTPKYLRNFIIPDMIVEGILLRTKPRTANGQTYFTNPKYRKE